MSGALVLTYHAVEPGAGALFIDVETFARHLDCIVEAGAHAVTASELAGVLRSGTPERPTVAVTFDDGFVSVVEHALPLLRARGLPATIFCVASRLGEWNDWPTARAGSPRRRLANAAELADAARDGFEIGAHGLTHAPLFTDDEELLWHELEGGREALAVAVGTEVRTFAYPYGASSHTARAVVGAVYSAAYTTEPRRARASDPPLALPRVDAHYLRRPRLLRAAVAGSLDRYLRARAVGAGVRRRFRPDYVDAAATRREA